MTTYLEDFVNFTAETTISSGINDSTTTIPVVTVTEIAAAVSGGNSPIRIRIDNELMLVTSSSSNDLTVVRGIEGTTAAAHSNGATVYPVLTKAGLVKRVEEGSTTVLTSTSTSLTLDDTYFTLLMNNSSDSTVTLPAAASMPGRSYTIKKVGNNTATVTIEANASETIDGALNVVLYCLYDFLKIQSDGTNWIVIQDGLQAHMAKMYNTASQSIPNGPTTKIEFNTTEFDNAGLADLSNEQFTIKRSGFYLIEGATELHSLLDDSEVIYLFIYANSARIAQNTNRSTGANLDTFSTISHAHYLTAGTVVDLRMAHNEGSAASITMPDGPYVHLSITEQRGNGGSGGSRTTAFNFTSQTGSSYNAVNGDYVLADLSSNSITVNLPQSPAINDRIGVKLKTASSSRTVTIDPYSTHEIDGQTTIILYIANDFIEIMWDGAMWRIISDGIQPHLATMTRNSAQSMATGSDDQIEYDTIQFDNASIATTGATARFTTKRAGKYLVTSHVVLSNLDDSETLTNYILVNGSKVNTGYTLSTAANLTVSMTNTVFLDLGAGDYIEGWLFQNEGAANNTLTGSDTRPRISIIEIRGGGMGSGGAIPLSEVLVSTPGAGAAGYGTTNTQIRRFTVTTTSVGTAITYADSSTNGGTFTINEAGTYAFILSDGGTTSANKNIGVSVNSNQLTTIVEGITLAHRALCRIVIFIEQDSGFIRCSQGDIVRVHNGFVKPDGTTSNSFFRIFKVSN